MICPSCKKNKGCSCKFVKTSAGKVCKECANKMHTLHNYESSNLKEVKK